LHTNWKWCEHATGIIPVVTIIYARYLLSKDVNMNMPAEFREECGLMLMIFLRCMTRFHSKMKLKAGLCLYIHLEIHKWGGD
jgi:hypothetical protein